MHACEACKCAHHGGGAARNWEHEGLHSGYVGSCPCACMRAYVHGEHAGMAWSLAFILHPSPASHETRTSSRKNSLHLHARTSAGACPAHALL